MRSGQAAKVDPEIGNRLAELRANGVQEVSVNDIGDIVGGILESLNGDMSSIDLTLFGELESLAVFIRAAKGDIASIQPQRVREQHLPSARDELDAIVGATERATEDIMGAVERIEEITADADSEVAEQVTDQVMRIYEACSFQDITGQRITKVISTLQQIESSIESMLAVFGDEVARQRVAELSEQHKDARERAETNLLHGPQLEGGANSQDEIDSILASFD